MSELGLMGCMGWLGNGIELRQNARVIGGRLIKDFFGTCSGFFGVLQ